MEDATTIEKNRVALLRLASVWLALALIARCARNILPPRITRFVVDHLFKAEAATGYLIIASSMQNNDAADQVFLNAAARHRAGHVHTDSTPLTLDDIICRLKAIRAALRRLRQQAVQTNWFQHMNFKTCIRYNPLLNCEARHSFFTIPTVPP